MRFPSGLSDLRALWTLARPRLLPHVVLLVFVGWAWAHWDRALPARAVEELAGVMVAWALLHAGTLWLNAAVDRDEGEVLLGRAVEPPPGTAAAGYLALAGAVGLAAVMHPGAGWACLGCAALSIAYSHPALLWKGHPLGGPMVNVVGYGVLSPLAGWLLVDVSANPRTLVVWVVAQFGVLGPYFAAQAFQQEEDVARGYRTFVATHGPPVTLRVARICVAAGFVSGLVLALIGWLPRSCLIGAVGWWWVDRWLVRWEAQPHGGDGTWAQGFARRMAYAVVLGVFLAFVEYAHQSFTGQPVAGLGTVAGNPEDRPRLPPIILKGLDHSPHSSR